MAGTAAGEIARALGVKLVLGAAGSAERATFARDFHHDDVSTTDRFEESTRAAAEGEGGDIALDPAR